MNCSRCGSINHCKDGIINGHQRYKCKDCNYHYTVARKSDVQTSAVKRQALELYLEGLGFRAIGRFLHISYGTVYQWVKHWKGHLELPDRNESIAVVELDEMHTYVGRKKNYCWIWIAVDRYGKRYLSFVCGDRSTKTGLKMCENIKGLNVCRFTSDHWRSYSEFIPPEKHVQTKAETFTIEGYNSRIRHYLARFKRKTKCYSKATFMIEISLNLLMMKLNN
ncbi:MAG: IS1 family transposase, partial [Prevotellaceae bacterium]|nr:IS1 family transposase [Prevotellaceae bacterium]